MILFDIMMPVTEDRIKAKDAGMDEHISKPIDMKLLVKIIHELVY